MSLAKEFKEFISRGNVVDLAVGVIIGGAFGGIVGSLVKDVVMPPISYILSGVDVASWKWVIAPAVDDAAGKVVKPEVDLTYGNFLQATLNFLIIALVIFFGSEGDQCVQAQGSRKARPAAGADRAGKAADGNPRSAGEEVEAGFAQRTEEAGGQRGEVRRSLNPDSSLNLCLVHCLPLCSKLFGSLCDSPDSSLNLCLVHCLPLCSKLFGSLCDNPDSSLKISVSSTASPSAVNSSALCAKSLSSLRE